MATKTRASSRGGAAKSTKAPGSMPGGGSGKPKKTRVRRTAAQLIEADKQTLAYFERLCEKLRNRIDYRERKYAHLLEVDALAEQPFTALDAEEKEIENRLKALRAAKAKKKEAVKHTFTMNGNHS